MPAISSTASCGVEAASQTRAVRLRRAFERGGPTFAKLAQQLSMRADMLPYAYCAELSKMLDRAAAFPTEKAIAIIERNLGRPLGDVFEVFDPTPIGSASLACVFQAQLKTGERVAVKVRRPGIGPLIAADLRAMDWMLLAGRDAHDHSAGSDAPVPQGIRDDPVQRR